MNEKQAERRSFLCEVRAENGSSENESIIDGRPIVYGSRTDLGWFDEIIDAGALDEADLTDVRFLVNHDLSKIPLARSRNNNMNSTMQLQKNENGLDITARIDIGANADAKALDSAVRRGDISGMSFMFFVDKDAWEDLESDHPTRHITSISRVVEVSAVTFPAYQATEIYARSNEALESAKQTLESARAQRAAETKHATDTAANELELAKAKLAFTKISGGKKK
jgi:HK97 family phage prohead protease